MPQSLSKIIVHLVFSTKNRKEWIAEDFQLKLHAYLATVARDQGWECYRVGGVGDHVHMALLQPRTANLSDFTGHVKPTSSLWIKQQDEQYAEFHWQKGYGAFSVSASQLDDLVTYISRQKEHHQKCSFQDEFRNLLLKYGVDYDERYVWD